MLDASNIVQVTEGNSGTASPFSFAVTFGSAVTGGNALILTYAFPGQTGTHFPNGGNWVSGGLGGGGGGGGMASVNVMSENAIDGETLVTTIERSAADGMAWNCIEVTGVMSASYDPYTFNTIGWDQAASDFGSAYEATSVDMAAATPTDSGDSIIFCSVAYRSASGTPAAFSSIADIAGGLPGTWTRYGTSQATSRASGDNVRLDSFYRFSGGEQAAFDARVTYASSSATAGMSGALNVWRAFTVVPQQTRGRASTNSTTY